jgi:hypothetical protein
VKEKSQGAGCYSSLVVRLRGSHGEPASQAGADPQIAAAASAGRGLPQVPVQVGAKGTQDMIRLALRVARGFQTVEQPADCLANGAHLALFVARSSPHVFAGPPVNFLQFSLRLFSLYVGRAFVIDHGLTLPPGLRHRPVCLPVIHTKVPLVINHCVAERAIGQVGPVHGFARRGH